MFTSPDAKKLASQLHPLNFDMEVDQNFVKDSAVQKYLNHYKINFSHSLSGVRHGFGRFSAANHSIACHYWIPEIARGTIFVVHGYYDHVGLFNNLIRFALQNEFAVVAFDLPGMGLSSGDRAAISDFDQYAEVFLECLRNFGEAVPKPWHCVGQSTGAAVVLNTLLNEKFSESPSSYLEKIVLLAPLVRSVTWNRDRWIYMCTRFFIRSIPRVFSENTHDQEFLAFLKKSDPLQSRRVSMRWVGAMKSWIDRFPKFKPQPRSVLVIQGDQDTTVDWPYNLAVIKEKLPSVKIKMVQQARHHMVAESAAYRAQVFAAIKRYWDS